MTDRGLRVAALGVGALTVALVVTTVVLAGTAAGVAIVARRPRTRIGWILLAPSFTLALEDMAVPAIVTTTVQPASASLWISTTGPSR